MTSRQGSISEGASTPSPAKSVHGTGEGIKHMRRGIGTRTQMPSLGQGKRQCIDVKAFLVRVKEYVEEEADTKVTSISFADQFTLLKRTDMVACVKTTDKTDPEWWVVGGDSPMNMYSTRMFRTADEAFSMHTGVILRLLAKEIQDAPDSCRDPKQATDGGKRR